MYQQRNTDVDASPGKTARGLIVYWIVLQVTAVPPHLHLRTGLQIHALTIPSLVLQSSVILEEHS